ncbi:NAD(P)-dependent alcohol dehydrogenase [uncultured Cardiobacterium sp.]|uniref:NAD(P)-dependent alcohol dehydrogenase n=1 Tax=uncultured Cardiobacterium sp. TaxID=417619 RepID=UPI00261E30A7|nr:NAD(P)-dependent alcohol dehydrogenase [uncultured Cardiobacterium sp.]
MNEISPQRRILVQSLAAAGILMSAFGINRAASASGNSSLNYKTLIPAEGYAFSDYSGKLHKITFQRRPVGDDDVAIEIRYCGVCHSDVHTAHGVWGKQQAMPQVTGHEIAGVVATVGKNVSRFKVGDRVGVGCFVDSCGHCAECRSEQEQYCITDGGALFTYGYPTSEARDPGGFTQGGYSNRIVVKERFVASIPEALPLEVAAPMLCSAVTAYSPLKHWHIGKGSKIGVQGLGGVGHMAVQIATALGAEVVVFTTSADKAEDAKRFGAVDVVVNYDEEKMAQYRRQLDFVFSTVPYQFEIDPILLTLKVGGTMCLIGVGDVSKVNGINPMTTALNRVNFAGSLTGSMKEINEVLNFCAEHKIAAQIQTIKPNQIGQYWNDVIEKKARYRYVIDMAAL